MGGLKMYTPTEEDINEFLIHKYLLENIVKAVQATGIVREPVPIVAETLVCVSKRVMNKKLTSTNLHSEDASGIGKDEITKKVSKIVFFKDWQRYDTPTPKAIIYGQRRIKLKKDDAVEWATEQPEITRETILHIKDASERFLNDDDNKLVFEGDVDITKVDNGRSFSVQFPKPIIIITTADTNTKNQLLRRLPSLSFDSSTEQTERIVEYQWDTDCNLTDKQNNPNEKLIAIARESFYKLKKVFVDLDSVKEYAQNKLPICDKVIMRTLNLRLMDFIKFSATLYQFQRRKIGIKEIKNEKYDIIEATKFDANLGYKIFDYIYRPNDELRASTLNKRQQNILEKFKQNELKEFTIEEIRAWEGVDVTYQQIKQNDLPAIMKEDSNVRINQERRPHTYGYKREPPSMDDIFDEYVAKQEN